MGTRHYVPGPQSGEDWIRRELQTISESTYGDFPDVQLVERHVAPIKPRTGMMVYADGTDWDPGSGAGVYVYTGSAWSKL